MSFNQMVASLGHVTSKYNVSKIIATLQGFLEAHKIDYAKALEVYQNDVTSKLKELNRLAFRKEFDKIVVHSNLGLITPVNCEKSYEKMIKLFSEMNDQEIELSFTDADHIFNDTWDFIVTAKSSNSFYSTRAK